MVSFSLERWLSVGSLGQRNLTVQRGADARTGGIVGWPIWPCRLSVVRAVAVRTDPDSRYALPAPVCYAGRTASGHCPQGGQRARRGAGRNAWLRARPSLGAGAPEARANSLV